MSRQDPSAATGMVTTRDLGRCACTHIEGVHDLGKTCSAAWVDGRTWIRCGCRRYTPQEAP